MTSTTMIRSCDSAVLCRRSMASVATVTAVSNPNVACVQDRSLSMVFGTPTMGMPLSVKRVAIRKAPSPPMAMRASAPTSRKRRMMSSETSIVTFLPSRSARNSKGCPLLTVPRMVPPRWAMPRTLSRVSSMSPSAGFSRRPWYPRRMPVTRQPRRSADNVTARMTAFSPGASPPPVLTRMYMSYRPYPGRGIMATRMRTGRRWRRLARIPGRAAFRAALPAGWPDRRPP